MKKLTLILLSILLISCNPFISKELRRKNKCNRKLDKVIRKCPELQKKDTTIAHFDTTIVINEVGIDTLVEIKFDTLELIKEKLRLKLIRTTDTLLISANCDADTIYIDKVIKVPYNKVEKLELTTFEKISQYWWLIVASVIILFILFRLKR